MSTSPKAAVRWGSGNRQVTIAFALMVATAGQARAKLSKHDRRQLERGEVITKFWKLKRTNIGTGRARGTINAAPERVFQVISDVGRYREFIKRVSESRIVRKGKKSYDFFYKIDMPWPLSDHWFITRNRHQIDRARRRYRRSWTLVKGTFLRNEGFWSVEPWPGGRSLVTYAAVLQPHGATPQSVVNFATKRSLPRSIQNLRRRVQQLGKRR